MKGQFWFGACTGLVIGWTLCVMFPQPTEIPDEATLAGLKAEAQAMSNLVWNANSVPWSRASDWILMTKRAAVLEKEIELRKAKDKL